MRNYSWPGGLVGVSMPWSGFTGTGDLPPPVLTWRTLPTSPARVSSIDSQDFLFSLVICVLTSLPPQLKDVLSPTPRGQESPIRKVHRIADLRQAFQSLLRPKPSRRRPRARRGYVDRRTSPTNRLPP